MSFGETEFDVLPSSGESRNHRFLGGGAKSAGYVGGSGLERRRR
jgi:hypothetical protein